MSIDGDAFYIILSAKSKGIVQDIFTTSFRYRNDGLPIRKIAEWKEEFDTSTDILNDLVKNVKLLIRECLFHSKLPTEVLPSDFHADLGRVLNRIVKDYAGQWRQALVNNQVSPAKLVDFDWRVDTKTASDNMQRMSAASLLLSLKVQAVPTQVGVMPETQHVKLELNPQELNVLLDGLLKIRDQLGDIAQ